MGRVKQIFKKSSRKSLKSSASLFALAAGAASWSGLAQAASEETTSQMMLLPEHYELMDNGVVVFKLETGENLSLTPDQYLILEDGLLLITDELAQASIYSLPVMGSVRAQLLTDPEQVATIDGTVAEATPAQTLSITEGRAPRLSEQVNLERYELAQNTDAPESTTVEPGSIELPGAAGGGLSLAALAITAGLTVEEASETEDSEPEAQTPPPAKFWQSTSNGGTVPEGADVTLNGTDGDDFFGYSAASTAAESPLVDFGRNSNVTVNAGNGSNYLSALDYTAGSSSATFVYNGGDGIDQIAVTDYFGYYDSNSITLNMGDGANSLSAGLDAGYEAYFRYNGGTGTDSIEVEDGAFQSNDLVIDLGNDTAVDTITFNGSFGYDASSAPVVQNFDVSDGDTIYLPTGITADISEITGSAANLKFEDSGSGRHIIWFEGIGPTGSDPTSAADLVAQLIT